MDWAIYLPEYEKPRTILVMASMFHQLSPAHHRLSPTHRTHNEHVSTIIIIIERKWLNWTEREDEIRKKNKYNIKTSAIGRHFGFALCRKCFRAKALSIIPKNNALCFGAMKETAYYE